VTDKVEGSAGAQTSLRLPRWVGSVVSRSTWCWEARTWPLRAGVYGLMAIFCAGSHGAVPTESPALTVGQFVIQSALKHVLIYRDACESEHPSMTRQFDQAAAGFRQRFDQAVAPLIEKYGARPQFSLAAPQTWTENLGRQESEPRASLSEVDADSCARMLSNLQQLDVHALLGQIESGLDQLTQIPVDQLKSD
jgi:hypothetical protein